MPSYKRSTHLVMAENRAKIAKMLQGVAQLPGPRTVVRSCHTEDRLRCIQWNSIGTEFAGGTDTDEAETEDK